MVKLLHDCNLAVHLGDEKEVKLVLVFNDLFRFHQYNIDLNLRLIDHDGANDEIIMNIIMMTTMMMMMMIFVIRGSKEHYHLNRGGTMVRDGPDGKLLC